MQQPEPFSGRKEKRNSLLSFTRLLVGGVLAGTDGLSKRLKTWEAMLVQEKNQTPENLGVEQGDLEDHFEDHVGNETETDLLRYAAIGLIFSSQDALLKSVKTADKVSRLVGGKIAKVSSPVYSSRLLAPVRDRIDRLAEHGQSQVENWIEVGRREEARSRALANTALTEQVDSSIEYLTSNQEVQELVQSQSVGLVGAIIEETRERTVSADNYLEAWVRTVLRRPMRSELPPPPPEIREKAAPYRRIHGVIVKK
jgi:hypothetical protein